MLVRTENRNFTCEVATNLWIFAVKLVSMETVNHQNKCKQKHSFSGLGGGGDKIPGAHTERRQTSSGVVLREIIIRTDRRSREILTTNLIELLTVDFTLI